MVKKIVSKIVMVPGRKYTSKIVDGNIIIEEEQSKPEWLDVTTELIDNKTCIAYYSPLKGVTKCGSNFKIEISPGGSLSVKIFKKYRDDQ